MTNNNTDKKEDDDHAFALADSFRIDTGDALPAVATGGSIISAVVNNTVHKISTTRPKTPAITATTPTALTAIAPSVDPSAKTTVTTAEAYTDNHFKALTWDNFDLDSDNNPVGVFGIPFAKFNFKQIRAIGLHFKIPRACNSKKANTIAGVTVAYQNRESYAQLDLDSDGKKNSDRRQMRCSVSR